MGGGAYCRGDESGGLGMTKEERDRRESFIKEYKNLMDKYGLYIASYDDCGAPWVMVLDDDGGGWDTTSQKQVEHLIRGLE